jgi:hypothetical protein
MPIEAARLRKVVARLMEAARQCFAASIRWHKSADDENAVAAAHHVIANNQHAHAEKFAVEGRALEDDAAKLNGQIEMRTTY